MDLVAWQLCFSFAWEYLLVDSTISAIFLAPVVAIPARCVFGKWFHYWWCSSFDWFQCQYREGSVADSWDGRFCQVQRAFPMIDCCLLSKLYSTESCSIIHVPQTYWPSFQTNDEKALSAIFIGYFAFSNYSIMLFVRIEGRTFPSSSCLRSCSWQRAHLSYLMRGSSSWDYRLHVHFALAMAAFSRASSCCWTKTSSCRWDDS